MSIVGFLVRPFLDKSEFSRVASIFYQLTRNAALFVQRQASQIMQASAEFINLLWKTP